MIIDTLNNAHLYYGVSDRIATALKFLQNTDLSQLSVGKHEIDGSNVYAAVASYQTKPAGPKMVWESHRQYIDVQCVVEGAERMGYAPIGQLKVTQEYKEDIEAILYEGQGDTFVLKAGMFAIFCPEDGHAPGLAPDGPQPVKKTIVKVHV